MGARPLITHTYRDFGPLVGQAATLQIRVHWCSSVVNLKKQSQTPAFGRKLSIGNTKSETRRMDAK